MELSEIRNEIDKLDKQIQNLFEERMLLCQDVARYKKAHNMPVFQAGREQQILDRVESNARDGLGLASRTMFANMMSISSQLQQKMLVAAEDAPEFKMPRMSASDAREQSAQTLKLPHRRFSRSGTSSSTPLLNRCLRRWSPANWNTVCCPSTTAHPAR